VPSGSEAAYLSAAQWSSFLCRRYIVAFNAMGGSLTPPSQSVMYNSKVTAPSPAPTLTGHTLSGWYKEAGYVNVWNFSTDVVTFTTTLYAKWTINKYLVTFNANGGAPTTSDSVTYNTTATAPNPAPTRAGYSFGGWYKEIGCINAWNFSTDVVTAATTLYAKWTPVYTVSFNAMGGSAVSTQAVLSGSKATEPNPAPTRTDYFFGGWYKEASYVNAWNFGTDVVTANITLYARWLSICTVTFNAMGGSPTPPSQSVIESYLATEPNPAPTRASYALVGWYKEAGCINAWNFSADVVTASITLYAKWTTSIEGCAGKEFTIGIPFRSSEYTVTYRWYRNGVLMSNAGASGTAASDKITCIVPAGLATGLDVVFYFEYMLNDGCNEWTRSPDYTISFVPQ